MMDPDPSPNPNPNCSPNKAIAGGGVEPPLLKKCFARHLSLIPLSVAPRPSDRNLGENPLIRAKGVKPESSSSLLSSLSSLKCAKTQGKPESSSSSLASSSSLKSTKTQGERKKAGGARVFPPLACSSDDEQCSRVIEHIYLGNDTAARNRTTLQSHGITHILNCAGFLCPEYFQDEFAYKTLWLRDSPSEDILSLLYDVFDYFEEVQAQPGARVLVHCFQGVSRSSSFVIAYLMWCHNLSFEEALCEVKMARATASPNMGFFCQLLQFQSRLSAAAPPIFPNPNPSPNPNPNRVLNSDPNPKPNPNTNRVLNPNPNPSPNTNRALNPNPNPNPNYKPKPNLVLNLNPNPKPKPKSKPNLVPNPNPEPTPKPNLVLNLNPKPKPKPKQKPKPNLVLDLNPNPSPNPKSKPNLALNLNPNPNVPKPKPNLALNLNPNPNPKPKPNLVLNLNPNPNPKSMPNLVLNLNSNPNPSQVLEPNPSPSQVLDPCPSPSEVLNPDPNPYNTLRIYRLAPHSAYDPLHLVPKLIEDPCPTVLDSRGAFLVQVPSCIYVWIGCDCPSAMLHAAWGAADQVSRYERVEGPITLCREGEETPEFRDMFSSSSSSSSESEMSELFGVAEKAATGMKKVADYDLDFKLFETASLGGVFPPIPSFGAEAFPHPVKVPTRETGWSRIRRKLPSVTILASAIKAFRQDNL